MSNNLPLLCEKWSQKRRLDDLVRGDELREIHLFNKFFSAFGGSEQETLVLYSLLAQRTKVHLWATSSKASKELLSQYPIRHVSLLRGQTPKGGVYVFLGAHWRNKVWPALVTKPDRLIYVFNTFHPRVPKIVSDLPFWLRWPSAELVLISNFQAEILGLDGVVHPSPIDISRFTVSQRHVERPFTIGRLSRDTPKKHSSEDVALYKQWLGAGFAVSIQGASVLENKMPADPNFVLTQEGQVPAEKFLQGLDVFFYRSGEHVETFGRVIFEAMACGVPVVCHRHGGYADHIQHGVNGYLFQTNAEAAAIIHKLQAEPVLRMRIGAAGRKTAESLFSDSALSKRTEFYL